MTIPLQPFNLWPGIPVENIAFIVLEAPGDNDKEIPLPDPQAFLDLAPDPSQPGYPVRAADRDMTGPEHRFCTGKLFLVSLSRQPYADNFGFGSFYSWFMRGWQANNSMSRTTDKPSPEEFF